MLCQVVPTEDAADKLREDNSYLPSAGGWVVVLVARTRPLLVNGFHSAFGGSMVALLDTSHLSSSEGGRLSVHSLNKDIIATTVF